MSELKPCREAFVFYRCRHCNSMYQDNPPSQCDCIVGESEQDFERLVLHTEATPSMTLARDALEFYADERNWIIPTKEAVFTAIDRDEGEKARAALSAINAEVKE